ncbi:MAG: hypothetical protein M1828_001343 [Chrysothrix sp. TS-e1954]|nr:MAG: hypothetical protein M1828_001343 [Chrysothrix sp. TS-e1954]
MPHATLSPTGFQAVILCGPGESLSPFNSNPKDFPKALLPIGNRPMIWYPLEWCHRMGITNITLITPPESQPALDAALSQNPHLTSLPSPKPTLLAPIDLEPTTGTAELFRLQEVQDAITGDFIVLPCDLVCELDGRALLEQWQALHGDLTSGGSSGFLSSRRPSNTTKKISSSHKGGLGVWYETRAASDNLVSAKKEETDFLATNSLPSPITTPPIYSLRPRIRNVLLAMPTDTVSDKFEESASLRIRRQLIMKQGRVRMLTTHRDGHIYLFPHWCKEFLRRNETFESLGEDAIGWWAKAGWQRGLEKKLHMEESLRGGISKRRKSDSTHGLSSDEMDEPDLMSLSNTGVAAMDLGSTNGKSLEDEEPKFASRIKEAPDADDIPRSNDSTKTKAIPEFHAYLHASHDPSQPSASLIRRIDTVPLLLSASLYLARLSPSTPTSTPTAPSKSNTTDPPPLPPTSHSHAQKHHTTSPLPSQATIPPSTTLIDANCSIAPRTTIKEAAIGAKCEIKSGVRINRSVLMEGCKVDEKAVLSECVLGRGVVVGKGAELRGCWVEHGYVVGEGAVEKGGVLAGFDEEGGGVSGSELEEGDDGDEEEEDG